MRQRARHVCEHDLHLPPEQRNDRGAIALERNAHDIDAGHALEQLRRKMRRRTGKGAALVELALLAMNGAALDRMRALGGSVVARKNDERSLPQLQALELRHELAATQQALASFPGDLSDALLGGIIAFYASRVQLDVRDAEYPVVLAEELRAAVRRMVEDPLRDILGAPYFYFIGGISSRDAEYLCAWVAGVNVKSAVFEVDAATCFKVD